MRFQGILLICMFCFSFGDARSSPNVEVVRTLFGNDKGARYSNNVIEDAELDVVSIS